MKVEIKKTVIIEMTNWDAGSIKNFLQKAVNIETNEALRVKAQILIDRLEENDI